MVYDAIIVGARCAGAPTAMLLARMGFRVLCVDKSTFPSDRICSHLIHPPGVARLRNWGLLEQVRDTCCPTVRSVAIDFGAVRLEGSPVPAGAVTESYCVRRTILDLILVQAAVQAGAEFRPAFTVQDLLTENGVVTGIRGRTPGGKPIEERGRIVIGADGCHSVVARILKAREYNVVEPLTCNYYSYWSGVPTAGAEWFVRPGRFVVAAPTNHGLTVVSVLKTRAEFRHFRANIEGGFLEALALAPEFLERVMAGKRQEGFAGTADTTNYFRQPNGPGWALIGDAGYNRDALTAQGISDAFRDADMISEALERGFTGAQPVEEALAEFHRQRDIAVGPMYRFTCDLARFTPLSPERLALLNALRGNQAQTSRFLGTLVGTVPLPDFYAAENIRQIRGISGCAPLN